MAKEDVLWCSFVTFAVSLFIATGVGRPALNGIAMIVADLVNCTAPALNSAAMTLADLFEAVEHGLLEVYYEKIVYAALALSLMAATFYYPRQCIGGLMLLLLAAAAYSVVSVNMG